MQILLDEGPREEPVNRPCWVPPVHHPELTLSAHHIFPGLSTLITRTIKTPRFTHFFRSSLWVTILGKRVYTSFVNLSLTRGPSWELRRYFSFPTMSYLVKTEWVVSTLRVIVSSKVKQSVWCSLRPEEWVLELVSPTRSQQLPCRCRHHFKGVNEPKTTGSYWEDSLLYQPGKMSGGCEFTDDRVRRECRLYRWGFV